MTTRPVDLFDLPILFKNRSSYIGLNTVKQLAHGNPLNLSGLISSAIPVTDMYTLIDPSSDPILGAIEHSTEKPSARISFLASRLNQYDERFIPLIEELCSVAGKNGAFHIVAETEETGQALNLLRRTGFAVYSTQKIFQVDPGNHEQAGTKWNLPNEAQRFDAKNLYEQITPPMILAIEPFFSCAGKLMACNSSRIYAWVEEGKAGTVVVPLAHPDEKNPAAAFKDLVLDLRSSGAGKIYFILRSTMSWFETILFELDGEKLRNEQVFVKHLVKFVLEKEIVKNPKAHGVTVLSSHIKGNDPGLK